MTVLDATVEYEHIRRFDARLTERGTPDWFIYLRAAEAGFDGIVTRDWHQSVQGEEMVALSVTSITIITWRKPIEDPVVEWGQLLAYMPLVRRLIQEQPRSVILLPTPHLDAKALRTAEAALGAMARDQGVSVTQVRREAREAIERELARRSREDLWRRYLAPRRRPPQRRR